MVRVILSLGIIAAIAGLMALGFGVPIKEFGLGNTLIIAGSTLFSSGLVVIALSTVLRAIDRLSLAGTQAPPAGRQPSEPVAARIPAARDPMIAVAPPPDQRALAAPTERPFPPETPPDWSSTPAPVRRDGLPSPAESPPMPHAGAPTWQDDEEELPPLPSVVRASAMPAVRPDRVPPAKPARPPARPERIAREPVAERAVTRPAPEEREQRLPPGLLPEESAPPERGHDPYAPPERRRVFGWTRRSKERGDEAGAPEAVSAAPEFGRPRAPAEESRYAPPQQQARRNAVRAPVRGPLPAEVAAAPGEIGSVETHRMPGPGAADNGRPAAAHGRSEPRRPAQPRVEVLKQGTVDGMSYTLYTDGSIDAEFPEGRLRFSSIDELRDHLEAQG